MEYDPAIHHRRSIRYKGYDYSQSGLFFVTVCTNQRRLLFGRIENGKMNLNAAGRCVLSCWFDLPNHYPAVELDSFVVMPNHIHGIVVLVKPLWAGLRPAPTKLAEVVRALKTFSARRINAVRKTPGVAVWQRNYYEHIIRNAKELDRTREYIVLNPLRWEYDKENLFRKYEADADPWLDS